MEMLVDDGEALLLDLLNSAPVHDGETHDELAGRGARAWLRAHGGTGSRAELEQTVAARTLLQRVARGDDSPTVLLSLLAGTHAAPTVGEDGVGWTPEIPRDRGVAVRAVLAWGRLQQTAPGRLRPCANDECTLFLVDHSKPNRARWCSMAVCGNRMKARRHYQRSRT